MIPFVLENDFNSRTRTVSVFVLPSGESLILPYFIQAILKLSDKSLGETKEKSMAYVDGFVSTSDEPDALLEKVSELLMKKAARAS